MIGMEIVSHNGLDIEVYDLRPADLHYYYYYYYVRGGRKNTQRRTTAPLWGLLKHDSLGGIEN